MSSMKTLENLFEETIRDIYYAEKKITKELPKMAKKATSPELKAGFEKHLKETEGHVERLEKIFAMMDKAPRGKTCPAIDGIAEEAKEIIENAADENVLDAGLIAAAQAVEHYEIARYGTLACWAKELGMNDAAKLLEATLKEEKATDMALTRIAESGVNDQALAA